MRCYGVAVPRVRILRPVTVILAGFSAALATGTGLLMLPFATVGDGSIGVLPLSLIHISEPTRRS